jgi:hypothetical protein
MAPVAGLALATFGVSGVGPSPGGGLGIPCSFVWAGADAALVTFALKAEARPDESEYQLPERIIVFGSSLMRRS